MPTLHAATASEVNGGDFVDPTRWGGARGYPEKVLSNDRSYDEALAKHLWAVSEELTGVSYQLPGR